jgi:hypothetical protein
MRIQIVSGFSISRRTDMKTKHEIYVVVEGGIVREVVGLPPKTQVTVLDYDIECHEEQSLQVSPLDGEPCIINKF